MSTMQAIQDVYARLDKKYPGKLTANAVAESWVIAVTSAVADGTIDEAAGTTLTITAADALIAILRDDHTQEEVVYG